MSERMSQTTRLRLGHVASRLRRAFYAVGVTDATVFVEEGATLEITAAGRRLDRVNSRSAEVLASFLEGLAERKDTP